MKLEPPAIQTVVGISGTAFPVNASDRLWEKYALGTRNKITDPKTKAPATRNIFLDGNTLGSEQSIQKRPFVFEAQGGLAIVIRQTRISYTQVWRSEEFVGQRKGDFFGSISISTKF